MSSFVVDPKTIGNIAGYVFANSKAFALLQREGIALEGELHQIIRRFSRDLEIMNRQAVWERYHDQADWETWQAGDFEFHGPTPVVVFKSLNCYLYQCSEGSVPDQVLFKALEKLRGSLAYEIATSSREYESGAWE